MPAHFSAFTAMENSTKPRNAMPYGTGGLQLLHNFGGTTTFRFGSSPHLALI